MVPLPESTKNKSVIGNNSPEKSKSHTSRKFIYIILTLIIGAFCMVAFLFFTGLLNVSQINIIGNKITQIIKTRLVNLRNDLAVTKKIIAKDGGTVTVKSPSGLFYSLYIPPGALSGDSNITLTPLSESPLTDFPGIDPGVNIGPDGISFSSEGTLTISNNNPDPGNDISGGQPGGGGQPPGNGPSPGSSQPPGGSGGFDEITPISVPPRRQPPGMEVISPVPQIPNLNGNNGQDIASIVGQYGIKMPDLSLAGNANPSQPVISKVPSPFDENSVIVVIDHHGGVRVPSPYTSQYSGISISVSGSGNVAPAASSTDAAKSAAGQAAVNAQSTGGGCTDEFILATERFINTGGKGDDISKTYSNILKRCKNERINLLEKQCKNDSVLLKRKDFISFLTVLRSIHDDEAVAKVENLMNTCTGQLEFETTDNLGAIVTKFNANVCGYVDDLWSAKMATVMHSGGDTVFTVEGTGTFNLPPIRGDWGAALTARYEVSSYGMNLPWAVVGYFDGRRKIWVRSQYMQRKFVEATIQMKSTCVSTVPLPGGPASNKQIQNSSGSKNAVITDAPPIKPVSNTTGNDLPPVGELPN